MPLPEGRKPLSNNDLKNIFKNMLKPFLESKDDFDIESLDPDKRSWYYDGFGNKRKKNE